MRGVHGPELAQSCRYGLSLRQSAFRATADAMSDGQNRPILTHSGLSSNLLIVSYADFAAVGFGEMNGGFLNLTKC